MNRFLFFPFRHYCTLALFLAFVSFELVASEMCEGLPPELEAHYPTYQQFIDTIEDGDDSRLVSWSRVGPKTGKPVIYSHGNPGSRFELLFFESIARAHNIAFYSMERPGFGCSPFASDYQLDDYAEDVVQLFKSRIDDPRVDAFGWSSGGPPTLSLGYYYPEWIDQLVLSSSYSNFGEMPEAKRIMAQYHRPGPMLSDKVPGLFHGLVALVGWASHSLPNIYFRVTEKEVAAADKRVLELNGIKPVFLLNQEQAFALGSQGAIQDLEVQWKPWPFKLSAVQKPVLLLQGGDDLLVPQAFAEHLNQAIPHSSLWLLKNQGHLFVLDLEYQEKILQWLSVETHQPRKVTNE